MQDVSICDDVIRLGQFLKLAGIADSGADAATMLAEDTVSVNGEPEQRRGRQLHKGDVVTVGAKLPVPQAWIRYAAKADEAKTARRLMRCTASRTRTSRAQGAL